MTNKGDDHEREVNGVPSRDETGPRKVIRLYDEDFVGFRGDEEGNLDLLVTAEQAREIERLAKEVQESLADAGED